MDAIDRFIEQYKIMAKDHYMNRMEKCKAEQKRLEELRTLKSWQVTQIIHQDFGAFVSNNRHFSNEVFERKVVELLEKDAESKKASLINLVEKKIGKIVDLKYMTVGSDGSLNGLIIGEDANASVQTIYAGGYNIQCLHYRVLVQVKK